ncbi:MAG: serine/threonine-protein kinase [Blautia sp.]
MERRYSGWSEWELMEKVGEGAFGKVYRARRVEGSREFYSAIKIITIPGSDVEINELGMEGMSESSIYTYFQGVVDDCINEIEMMERLKGNSNIVVVEDFKVVEHPDAMGWDIHIRMELLESFVKYIGGRDLSEEEVVRLGIDICSGLVLCEQQNIIHRDIKPENIFVSTAGNFKLGDFGIARKLERTKGAMSHKGTYSYMAPEVFYGKIYDRSIDTYSLGLVLYRLLNKNRGPFLRTDSEFVTYQDKEEALRRRMEGERLPMPCQASPALAQVILRGLQLFSGTPLCERSANAGGSQENPTRSGGYGSPASERPRSPGLGDGEKADTSGGERHKEKGHTYGFAGGGWRGGGDHGRISVR